MADFDEITQILNELSSTINLNGKDEEKENKNSSNLIQQQNMKKENFINKCKQNINIYLYNI